MSRTFLFRRTSSKFYFLKKIAPKRYLLTKSNEIFIPTCFPRMINPKIFQEKINLDSLKKFHGFLLSYQLITKIQPMKNTAPSAYIPAPTAWRQSWLFANKYILIKDIPAHANPANRIPSTAIIIILKTSFLFSVPKVYTKFQKKSRKIFFRRNSSNFFVKKFTSNRSSKFFCEIFHNLWNHFV